ncbi:MAG: copper-binding protein [Notoacmeibacter sp.]|nr:copper-binding protein [Notoacmeibacter sp.]
MKNIATALVATTLAIAGAGPVFATDYTKGTIRKIDNKTGKVTIAHEDLKNLDMPAMTMVFVLAEDGMLEKIREGQVIEFVADRVKGKLTVTEIKQ